MLNSVPKQTVTDFSEPDSDSALIIIHRKTRAICSSDWCLNKARTGISLKKDEEGVVKLNARKHSDWCPDCGHALFWQKYSE